MTKARIGIMSAMKEEIEQLISELRGATVHSEGMRDYHEGTLWGVPVVLVFSRWGKVAASATATHLIARYGISRLIFTGVAGGVAPGVHVGDVVVGSDLYQHDIDARPLFAQHEVPLHGKKCFSTDPDLKLKLTEASRSFFRDCFKMVVHPEARAEFSITAPKVRVGEIASGDQFFAERERVEELLSRLPDVLCVEMEGAAVAQVCYEYGVPFGIIRTISDSADEHAPISFPNFIRGIAQIYSHGILRELLEKSDIGE